MSKAFIVWVTWLHDKKALVSSLHLKKPEGKRKEIVANFASKYFGEGVDMITIVVSNYLLFSAPFGLPVSNGYWTVCLRVPEDLDHSKQT